MIYKRLSIITTALIFLMSLISAVPNIQILSPENTTYDTNKILVNVTSNELADFYIKSQRGDKIVVAENTTIYQDYFYIKDETKTFTIYVNNSNGEDNDTITFTSSVHNPINITSCGRLYSSDAEYILQNDISTTSSVCLSLLFLRNVTLDLNEYTVNTGTRRGIDLSYSSDISVYNGNIFGAPIGLYSLYPIGLQLEGTKYRFENLTISSYTGSQAYESSNIIFQNVTINATYGFKFYSMKEIYFINSNFSWNNVTPQYSWQRPANAFLDSSYHSNLILENVTISNFPYDFYLEGAYTDVFLRNTDVNMSGIYYPSWVADTRFFDQHLIIVNITDQFNLTGSCSIKVLDNGILPRIEGEETITETLSNPTAKFYIPTGETGEGEAWITEKLTLARSSSPPEITEYDFSNYTLTTKGWGSENYSQINLNLTDINSIIYIDFKINTSNWAEELPECTISQMLDLNNDEVVDIQDAVIILRHITGLPVSSPGAKNCTGINLNPF
jgi:hypothetical protein